MNYNIGPGQFDDVLLELRRVEAIRMPACQ